MAGRRAVRHNPHSFPLLKDVLKYFTDDVATRVRNKMLDISEVAKENKADYEEAKFVQPVVEQENKRRLANELESLPQTYEPGVQDEETVRRMPYRNLIGTDMETSLLSYGAGAAAGTFCRVERNAAVDSVREALKLGINYFDTSPLYGEDRWGERLIAEGLEGVPRHCYYVGTKVGRYLERKEDTIMGGERWKGINDYTYKGTMESVERSLEILKVDYIDIVNIQDIHFCQEGFGHAKNGAITALHELQSQGIVRYWGLAGYELTLMASMIRQYGAQITSASAKVGGVPYPSLLQCVGHYNLLLHDLMSEDAFPQRLPEYCFNKRVGCMNAAPMAMGLLSPRPPPHWHPAHGPMRKACREVVEYCKYRGVCPTRICLRFALKQDKILASHITGLATAKEVRSAVDVATTKKPTVAEAECLNWALGRLELVDKIRWDEPDAMMNTDGPLSDDAEMVRKRRMSGGASDEVMMHAGDWNEGPRLGRKWGANDSFMASVKHGGGVGSKLS